MAASDKHIHKERGRLNGEIRSLEERIQNQADPKAIESFALLLTEKKDELEQWTRESRLRFDDQR